MASESAIATERNPPEPRVTLDLWLGPVSVLLCRLNPL
jgi:hypothetical protein